MKDEDGDTHAWCTFGGPSQQEQEGVANSAAVAKSTVAKYSYPRTEEKANAAAEGAVTRSHFFDGVGVEWNVAAFEGMPQPSVWMKVFEFREQRLLDLVDNVWRPGFERAWAGQGPDEKGWDDASDEQLEHHPFIIRHPMGDGKAEAHSRAEASTLLHAVCFGHESTLRLVLRLLKAFSSDTLSQRVAQHVDVVHGSAIFLIFLLQPAAVIREILADVTLCRLLITHRTLLGYKRPVRTYARAPGTGRPTGVDWPNYVAPYQGRLLANPAEEENVETELPLPKSAMDVALMRLPTDICVELLERYALPFLQEELLESAGGDGNEVGVEGGMRSDVREWLRKQLLGSSQPAQDAAPDAAERNHARANDLLTHALGADVRARTLFLVYAASHSMRTDDMQVWKIMLDKGIFGVYPHGVAKAVFFDGKKGWKSHSSSGVGQLQADAESCIKILTPTDPWRRVDVSEDFVVAHPATSAFGGPPPGAQPVTSLLTLLFDRTQLPQSFQVSEEDRGSAAKVEAVTQVAKTVTQIVADTLEFTSPEVVNYVPTFDPATANAGFAWSLLARSFSKMPDAVSLLLLQSADEKVLNQNACVPSDKKMASTLSLCFLEKGDPTSRRTGTASNNDVQGSISCAPSEKVLRALWRHPCLTLESKKTALAAWRTKADPTNCIAHVNMAAGYASVDFLVEEVLDDDALFSSAAGREDVRKFLKATTLTLPETDPAYNEHFHPHGFLDIFMYLRGGPGPVAAAGEGAELTLEEARRICRHRRVVEAFGLLTEEQQADAEREDAKAGSAGVRGRAATPNEQIFLGLAKRCCAAVASGFEKNLLIHARRRSAHLLDVWGVALGVTTVPLPQDAHTTRDEDPFVRLLGHPVWRTTHEGQQFFRDAKPRPRESNITWLQAGIFCGWPEEALRLFFDPARGPTVDLDKELNTIHDRGLNESTLSFLMTRPGYGKCHPDGATLNLSPEFLTAVLQHPLLKQETLNHHCRAGAGTGTASCLLHACAFQGDDVVLAVLQHPKLNKEKTRTEKTPSGGGVCDFLREKGRAHLAEKFIEVVGGATGGA
eukprot:g1585.t1